MKTQISPLSQQPEKSDPDVDQHQGRLAAGDSSGVTIGIGGQFPTLKEAIDTLLANGETRLCFSLLPGEHTLDGQVVVRSSMPRLHFSLEGVGGRASWPCSVVA